MADDDQVNEAKSDIDAVRDIVGAPDTPPVPPPTAPPTSAPPTAPAIPVPSEENLTADLDAKIAQANAQAEAWRDKPGGMYAGSERGGLETEKAQRQKLGKQGCSPTAIVILALVGLVAGLVGLGVKSQLDDNGSSKTSAGAGAASDAASSCDQSGARADRMVFIDCAKPSGLDGHWVLQTPMSNIQKDFPGGACSICVAIGVTPTFENAELTIDISGTKITGGTYKNGYTAGPGDPCKSERQHYEGAASGGVDLNQNYGTLILDGTEQFTSNCDASGNAINVAHPNQNHVSRFFYVQGDTMFLCYNIDPTTFQSCTDPAGGSAATLKRG